MIYLGEHIVGLNAPFESEDKPVIKPEYVRPSNWPNLEAILAAHPASEKGYGYAYAMLVEGRNPKSQYNYIRVPPKSAGCRYYVTSWGLEGEPTNAWQSWVLSDPEIYQEFEWIIVYTDSENDIVTWGPSFNPYCYRWLLWFYAPGATITSPGYATGFCGILSMREFTAKQVNAHSYFFQFGMQDVCKIDVEKYVVMENSATRLNGTAFPQKLDTSLTCSIELSSTVYDIHDWFNSQYYVEQISKFAVPSAVNNANNMFTNCYSLTGVDVSDYDMQSVLNCNSMFSRCESLQKLDASNWDMRNVRTAREMFNMCRSLRSVSTESWNMSSLSDAYQMFANCNSLESICLSAAGMQNVTNFQSMFSECNAMKYADCRDWNVSAATTMRSMFSARLLVHANLSGWNFGNSLSDTNSMFANCFALEDINASGWNFKCTSTMEAMFNACYRLKSLDVHGWDVSEVKTMKNLFFQCQSLSNLNISDWNTSSVSSMENMFLDCRYLESLDVSSWNTSNVVNMYQMFAQMNNLSSIDISNWDMSKVTNANNMFINCYALQSVKMPNVTRVFANQFNYCTACLLYDFRACTQVPTLDNTNAFLSINANAKIVVPDSLYSAWRTSTNWSNSTIQSKIISATDYENSL